MKIAVLISGQYREFAIAVKSWNFIPKGATVDFYLSTWNISYDDSYYRSDDEISIPVEGTIENVTIGEIKEIITLSDFRILPEIYGNTVARYIHLIKNSIQMLVNSNTKYDHVMLIRPDLWIDNILNISIAELLQADEIDNDVVYGSGLVQGYMDMPEVRDCFWISNQATMIKFLNLPNLYEKFGTEKLLGQFYIDNNLKSILIPNNSAVRVVRSNCRNIENLTTEIVSRKACEWWNIKHPENAKI